MNFDVIKEEFVSHAEVKEILKGKKDLEVEQKFTKEHVNHYKKLTPAKAVKLKNELESLNMTKLKPELIVKIINLIPTDIDDLKVILQMSVIPFTDEEIEKIFEYVKPYV